MEVKRAFRKYLGPDDPGPFSDMINSMSFGCRHMKEFNRNGVFCLTGNIPEGRVKLMRVGDVDYIWTYGGTGALYIILIPDLTRGFVIPVTLAKDEYIFQDFSQLTGGNIVRYEFDKDYAGITGVVPRQQYMPYIFKQLGMSHASVGDLGFGLFPDPVNDWHNKFYVLDCTGEQSTSEILWRPPSQVTTVGFGEDLLPLWYAMSPLTAHNFHWCFEAAIDQSKRIYQPINTDVILASKEISIPLFSIVWREGFQYNFLYPLSINRFYGKNAFDVVTTENGKVITAFAESIYVSGVATASIPVEIDPILFFWPWIPYLDEIRSLNFLRYEPKADELGHFQFFHIIPSLDTLKKYNIGSYSNIGEYQTQELFEDAATFSNVTRSNDNADTGGPVSCSCGECGTGEWQSDISTIVNPYNSSGTRYIPIGLIGGKIPISMKTVWSQSGSGPKTTYKNKSEIIGNYPWVSLHSGSYYGLSHWYEVCCITSFQNTNLRIKETTETASNNMTLSQKLTVGEDVIFEGNSSMSYNMEYNYQDRYDGTINGTVVPPDFVPPECAGSISYTTQQMTVNQTQSLHWNDNTSYPAARPCEDPMAAFVFTWSLSGGGSLSSTTAQNIVYTAPSANEGCTNNATISLLCNGAVVDTLEIAINAVASTVAYDVHEFESYISGQPGYYRANNDASCIGRHIIYRYTKYYCDGTVYYTSTNFCVRDDGGSSGSPGDNCCTLGQHDLRSAAQITAGCCPAALM